MECLVQYLDNLEDLIFAAALKAERVWQSLRFFLFVATAVALQLLGVIIAIRTPPIALALVALLFVGMLYRAVVSISFESCATT